MAQVTPSPDAISPAGVGAIIGAVIAALLGGGYLGKKVEENRKVSIDPPNLQVKLEKDFVTRREHEIFRAEVRGDFSRLEALVERGAERVDEKHMQLIATIERAAKTGVDGRVALWNDLKKQGEAIAALKERTDISKELQRIADSTKQQNKQ